MEKQNQSTNIREASKAIISLIDFKVVLHILWENLYLEDRWIRGERLYIWFKGECIVQTAVMIVATNYFLLIIEIVLIAYVKANAGVPFSTGKTGKDGK